MKTYEIYMIANKSNEKNYIGYTSIGISRRLHKHYLNSQKGIDTKLYRAIRKYGINNFYIKIIDTADSHTSAKKLEILYIEKYKSYEKGYNSTIGGDGGDIVGQLSGEKYNIWKNKIIKNSTGEKNPRFSGYTDESIIDFASECYIKNGFNWIPSSWIEDYCNIYKIPKSFSKYRFSGKGFKGFRTELIIKLNDLGYDVKDIKYKKTESHNKKLGDSLKGRFWYHNDFLKISKQIHENDMYLKSGWEKGRKKY